MSTGTSHGNARDSDVLRRAAIDLPGAFGSGEYAQALIEHNRRMSAESKEVSDLLARHGMGGSTCNTSSVHRAVVATVQDANLSHLVLADLRDHGLHDIIVDRATPAISLVFVPGGLPDKAPIHRTSAGDPIPGGIPCQA